MMTTTLAAGAAELTENDWRELAAEFRKEKRHWALQWRSCSKNYLGRETLSAAVRAGRLEKTCLARACLAHAETYLATREN